MFGGLVGHFCYSEDYSAIFGSNYNQGNVSAEKMVGGLIGYMDVNLKIRYCYSSGDITGNTYVGGIVGYMEGTEGKDIGKIESCFYLEGTAEQPSGLPLSKGEVKTEEELTGFTNELGEEFVYEEGSYPKLKWEKNVKE